MHVHLLGICGTFMGGLALIARELGHHVTGSDTNVYPPMSTQLAAEGVEIREGYLPAHLDPAPDLVVVGNALSRGNPCIEVLLDSGLKYTSGPQWLFEEVLRTRQVLAVAGTHGKTTTSSMLTLILEKAGLNPGFLIGGVPGNFERSARLGDGNVFVIEADEYDTAFFDKRSKFVHYHPEVAVLGNLEFDHADIFDDLDSIKRQFHHLVRIIPRKGTIVANADSVAINEVIEQGCWSRIEYFRESNSRTSDHVDGWEASDANQDASCFHVRESGQVKGRVDWRLFGRHNMINALAAVAAAAQIGVEPSKACEALHGFEPTRRRLQLLFDRGNIRLYDDFAHHPTAIAATLDALRQRYPADRLIAVFEPRSNTMRLGIHKDALASALASADITYLYRGTDLTWGHEALSQDPGQSVIFEFDNVGDIVTDLLANVRPNDRVVIMSNGGFDGLSARLTAALDTRS